MPEPLEPQIFLYCMNSTLYYLDLIITVLPDMLLKIPFNAIRAYLNVC